MNKLRSALIVALASLLVVFTVVAHASSWGTASASQQAEQTINENPLIANLKVQPFKVGIGGTAEFIVEMELAADHFAYLEQFKFAVDAPDGLKLDSPRITPIVQFMDTVSKKMKNGIKEKGEMRVLFEVPAGFEAGEHTVEVRLTYQACTKDYCLFPKTLTLKSGLEITSGMTSSATAAGPGQGPTSRGSGGKDFESALDKGLITALVFVFFMGFLTSLTPCVYPMIPITLAVIGARARNRDGDRIRSLALSIVYVLGIAVSYSLLGVFAATTGALFGSALSNIWVVTTLALIFIAMGLSMYGVFEIQAPAFLRNRFGTGKTDAGFIGAFFTGVVAGVVASPCVGPVLVSVLTYIAKTQDKFLGFTLLFTFALGMGLLFIAIGVSSSLFNRLPKAGPWMEGVKFAFGTTMIAMALYYIEPLYPTWLFRTLLGLAVLLIASSFGAFTSNEGLSPLGRIRKGLMLAAFIVGAAFAVAGILEKSGVSWAQPGAPGLAQGPSGVAEDYPKLAWQPYSDKALEDAIKAKRPVLIDFWAEWCAACKELERYTFIDARIRGLSDQFTLLKIDATEDSPDLGRLKKKYQVVGLPTMVFYDTKGVIRDDLTVTGFEEADPFLARMQAAAGAP